MASNAFFLLFIGTLSILSAYISYKKINTAGASGSKGVSGIQGPKGPIGPMGPIGPSGETGPSGFVGPKGYNGPIGPAGVTGPMGPTGPTGSNNEAPTLLMSQEGATGPNSLFSSFDDGQTWQTAENSTFDLNPMTQCASNGVILVGVGPSNTATSNIVTPYYSLDFGRSWQASSLNAYDFGCVSLNCVAWNGSEFWIGGNCSLAMPTYNSSTSSAIFVSTDGLSWIPQAPLPTYNPNHFNILTYNIIRNAVSLLWTGKTWVVHGYNTFGSCYIFYRDYQLETYNVPNSANPKTWICNILPYSNFIQPLGPQSIACRKIITGNENQYNSNWTDEIIVVGNSSTVSTQDGTFQSSIFVYAIKSILDPTTGTFLMPAIWTIKGSGESVVYNGREFLVSGSFLTDDSSRSTNLVLNSLYSESYSWTLLDLIDSTYRGNSAAWTGRNWVITVVTPAPKLKIYYSNTYENIIDSISSFDESTYENIDLQNIATTQSRPAGTRRFIWTPNTWTFRPSLANQVAALQN